MTQFIENFACTEQSANPDFVPTKIIGTGRSPDTKRRGKQAGLARFAGRLAVCLSDLRTKLRIEWNESE